jgi:hypothetical protein
MTRKKAFGPIDEKISSKVSIISIGVWQHANKGFDLKGPQRDLEMILLAAETVHRRPAARRIAEPVRHYADVDQRYQTRSDSV